jgi:hypothetical protein
MHLVPFVCVCASTWRRGITYEHAWRFVSAMALTNRPKP